MEHFWIWIADLDNMWAGRFWCLNGARYVLKSGEIKVEARKARNFETLHDMLGFGKPMFIMIYEFS